MSTQMRGQSPPHVRPRLRLVAVGASLLAALLGGAVQSPTAQGAAPPRLASRAVVTPPPEHRADPMLRTYVVRAGAYSISPYGFIKRTDTATPPPVAGSIVGMDMRLVDSKGRVVPQHIAMLHHFLMTNGGPDDRRRDGSCSQRPVRERFYGTSEELRAMTFPRGYGYPDEPA